ncbi:MAG: fumarylacetoacetate hydrolase family protein [Alphaproteobacteria bacterium]|nr:fumarylacetoacetate hydrolase family protein [Alphaproteobacteria bacterium]
MPGRGLSARIADCADLLLELRGNRRQLDCLPLAPRPRDEREAYQVQFALHERLSQAGHGARVGWKIGCTTKVMQVFLNIPSPCAGGIFEIGLRQSPAGYDFAALRKPGVECEIAVRLAADVPLADAPYDRSNIAPYIGSVMSAMEVIEERFTDFHDEAVDAPTLIADDFFHLGAVLGQAVAPSEDLDLAALSGQNRIDDQVMGSGQGADVMGHPYAALAWLANHLAQYDVGLRAGDVVLTGSIVTTKYPDAPGPSPVLAVTEIAGLGQTECIFR